MKKKANNVFITGGCGFIGSYIAKELIGLGYRVILYDAFLNYLPSVKSSYKFFLQERLKGLTNKAVIIKGDIRNQERLTKALIRYQPDSVIHLAALPIAKIAAKLPVEAISVNLGGTRKVLQSLEKVNSIKRFMFASSCFAYGDFEYLPADEKHPTRPIDIYGETKLAGEILTKAFCQEQGIGYTIIRLSSVYGFGDANGRVTQIMIENAMKRKPLILHNEGKTRLDFTYIKDVVHGFVLALHSVKAKNQILNITRGEGRSVKKLAQVIKNNIPGTRIVNEPTGDIFRPSRGALAITNAKKLLGYVSRYSLEKGIEEYIIKMKECGIFK